MVLAQIGVGGGLHLCVSRQLHCCVLAGCKACGAPGKAAMLHQLLIQGSQRACLGCGLTLPPRPTAFPQEGGWRCAAPGWAGSCPCHPAANPQQPQRSHRLCSGFKLLQQSLALQSRDLRRRFPGYCLSSPDLGKWMFPSSGNTTASLKNNLPCFQCSSQNRPRSFYLSPGHEAKII